MMPLVLCLVSWAFSQPLGEQSTAVALLREVANDVASRSITADTEDAAERAAAILNLSCRGVGEAPALSAPVIAAGGELRATAVVETRPDVDCPRVRRQFVQAKRYWAELICIVGNILKASAYSRPNLRYINRLTKRAETLRGWIDGAFPAIWDERRESYTRSWQPETGSIHGFEWESLRWGGLTWQRESLPPFWEVSWAGDIVSVHQTVSVTNYCLEPQQGFLTGTLTVGPDNAPTGEWVETLFVLRLPG